MLLDQYGASESEQGGWVGEDADDVGASFDLFVDPLQRVRRPDLAPVFDREASEREEVFFRVVEHGGDLRVGALEHAGDLVELGPHVWRVGLGEDRADDRGDHVLGALGHDREHVAHEVDPAIAAKPCPAGPC